MIKLFRNIRKKLLEQGKLTNYLKYAIGEIFLVVIGILIALQINNWNEKRKAKFREQSTMTEIIENLKYDIVRCNRNSRINTERLIGLDSLRTSVRKTIEGKDETASIYYFAMKYGQEYSQVTLNSSAYDQLINSGTIQQIYNRQLVLDLSDYYERKSSAVAEFEPRAELSAMLTMQKKFIQYRGLDEFVQSFDSMNDNSFEPDYDYSKILKMGDLKLLQPVDLSLDDYFNEISQFEIDLKKYNFYMSWAKEAAEQLIKVIEKEYHTNHK